MDEKYIEEEFSKCESLKDLSDTAFRLKQEGGHMMIINRARMKRQKELVSGSRSSIKVIPKCIVSFPEDKDPISSMVMDTSLLNSAIVGVSNGVIII